MVLALLLPVWLWAGCAANKTSDMTLDSADFANVADGLANAMLESGVFDKVSNPPAKLRVSALVNNTAEHFDTDLLARNIRIALSKSGKAVTILTPSAPVDYELSGKIIETRLRSGNVRQQAYSFFLTLADPDGRVVWEDKKEVTKTQQRGLGL